MELVDGVVVTYSGVEHVVNVERLEELVVVRELCLSVVYRILSCVHYPMWWGGRFRGMTS